MRHASPALAKLSAPRMHQAVARERLFTALDEAAAACLTWVSGPPGAGKTTLAASYLAVRRAPHIWYQVDSGDADPAAFFYYLRRAVLIAGRRRGATLPLPAAEQLNDLTSFARVFFRLVAEQIDRPRTLVLDNYQEGDSAGLREILRVAGEELAGRCRLLVVSRAEPPTAFVEAEARGQIAHIDWQSLRMTLDEVRSVCAARGVDDWLARGLHEQSDGWAGGVTLMLERLRRRSQDAPVFSADTHESIFAYFANLLFDKITPAQQRILMRLSFLVSITPQAAQTLSGSDDAQRLLEDLYRRHLFTERRAGAQVSYQFHGLLRSFLQARARSMLDPAQYSALLREASSMLAESGENEQAMQLLSALEDWPAVKALILDQAPLLARSGRWRTVDHWISSLPEDVRENDAWLLYWLGASRLATAPEEAQKILTGAHEGFARAGDTSGRIMAASAILRAYYLSYAQFAPAKHWIPLLAELLRADPPLANAGVALEAYSVMLLAHTFRSAPMEDTQRWAVKVEELLQSDASNADRLMGGIALLQHSVAAGRIDLAQRVIERLTDLANEPDVTVPVKIMWRTCEADHYQLTLQPDACAAALQQVKTLAHEYAIRYAVVFAGFLEGQGHLKARRFAQADAITEALQPLIDRSRRIEVMHGVGTPPWRHVWSQNYPAAIRDGRIALEVAKATRVPYFHALWVVPVVVGLAGIGDCDGAMELLENARAAVRGTSCNDCNEIVFSMLEAYCCLSRGDLERALDSIRPALRAAHVFGREVYLQRAAPEQTAAVLATAIEHDIEPDLVRRVIRRFDLPAPCNADASWPWPLALHCFGAFDVRLDDRPLEFSGKLPRKVLLLLKALVAFGPGDVNEQTLVDALWPDEEGDAGHKALNVTVLRLRRLLGDQRLVVHQGGKVGLMRSKCWVDAWAFEQRLPMACNGDSDGSNGQDVERVLALYRGAFLTDDVGEWWTVPARERLRGKFVHALSSFGRELEAQGRPGQAIDWYLKGVDADPIVEAFYQGLMRCYEQLQRRTEAIAAYRRLKQVLSVTLGLPPSAMTERLYQSIRESA